MSLRMRIVALGFALTLSLPVTAALPPVYIITDLGTLDDPAATLPTKESFGYGVNDQGHIVGAAENGVDYGDGTSQLHPFLHDGLVIHDLGTLTGGTYGEAFVVNNSEYAVGYSWMEDGSQIPDSFFHAVLFEPGNPTPIDLGTLTGGSNSEAKDINSSGQIVGYSWAAGDFNDPINTADAVDRAFLYPDPATGIGMKDLPTLPGGTRNYAFSINDSGRIVGYSWLPGTDPLGNPVDFNRAYLYDISSDHLKDLDRLPNGSNSRAAAINNNDEVVGYSQTQDGVGTPDAETHAFACAYDSVTDSCPLSDLGTFSDGTYSYARDNNDQGQVVGYGKRLDPVTMEPDVISHAFIYDPVDLPSDPATQLHDLNDLIPTGSGWELISAEAINNKGQITGYGTHNGVRHAFLLTPDSDNDGVGDPTDTCTLVANPGPAQLDTDGDGIGNLCDCDFNQDNFCGGPDFTLFIGCFNKPAGTDPVCQAADMNGDGFVGGPDFTLFIGGFNKPPGPPTM